MDEIVEYKNKEYKYSEAFWGDNEGRKYENLADQAAIIKGLPKKMDYLIDIGGGYGRLVPLYQKIAKNIILMDTSRDELLQAKEAYSKMKNLTIIRGNAYELPFADQSLPYGLCVRIMHHLTNQARFLKEINRVFTKLFYLEFPNKRHLAQICKYIFLGNREMHIFDDKPEVRDKMFLNYSPKYMTKLVEKETDFSISRRIGVSFFRSRTLKKIFPISFLMGMEKLLQKIQIKAWIAPSNIFVLTKPAKRLSKIKNVKGIMACPKCHAKLNWQKHKCTKCSFRFSEHDGIIDMMAAEKK